MEFKKLTQENLAGVPARKFTLEGIISFKKFVFINWMKLKFGCFSFIHPMLFH